MKKKKCMRLLWMWMVLLGAFLILNSSGVTVYAGADNMPAFSAFTGKESANTARPADDSSDSTTKVNPAQEEPRGENSAQEDSADSRSPEAAPGEKENPAADPPASDNPSNQQEEDSEKTDAAYTDEGNNTAEDTSEAGADSAQENDEEAADSAEENDEEAADSADEPEKASPEGEKEADDQSAKESAGETQSEYPDKTLKNTVITPAENSTESDLENEIPESDLYYLPLFGTSDIHGTLADTSGSDPLYYLAYISDKVNDVRGTRKDKVILLDGGDIYQGSTLSNLLYGDPLSAAFQIMEYDAVTIGNHEFDWGLENMIDPDHTMKDYTIGGKSGVNSVPTIICNLYRNGEHFSRADEYMILEKTAANEKGEEIPVRVAVIGYAGDYSASVMYDQFEAPGYSIDPDLQKVNALAASLENSGACDATVLLAHEEASRVARGLGENTVIDLVLGGHSHQSIKGITEWNLNYLEPSGYAGAYVYAELAFSADKDSPVFRKVTDPKVISTKRNPSRLTNTPENKDELDQDLVKLTDEVILELSNVFDSEIGYITESALRFTYLPDSGERATTCGNWMTSILARGVGADACFINSAGIRTEFPIEKGEDKRTIRLADIYALFPFGNTIYCYEITYEELLTALQYSLTKAGKILLTNLSGIDCYYTDQTVNAIVTSNGEEVYVNGEWKVEWKERKLRVAVNEYAATTNRISADGRSNPFYVWRETERLLEHGQIDNESAVTVLTNEAAANNGHLSIDTRANFINTAYVPKQKEDEAKEDTDPEKETEQPQGNDPADQDEQKKDTDQDSRKESAPADPDGQKENEDPDSAEQTPAAKAGDSDNSPGSSSHTPSASTDKSSSSQKKDTNHRSDRKHSTSPSGTSGNSAPQTGDDSSVLLWSVLLTASGAAVLIVWIIRKKHLRE